MISASAIRLPACFIATWSVLTLAVVLATAPAHAGWVPNGTPLSRAPDFQSDAQIATDGVGGAFVAWADERDWLANRRDLYLQRVTSAGDIPPFWPSDGLLVSNAPREQFVEDMISDGAGGVLLGWFDTRNDTQGDVYLQRITALGAVAPGWPAGGLPVATGPGRQDFVHLVTDGLGGAFVGWADPRSGNYATYLQRVLGDGTIAPGWPVDGKNISPHTIISGIPQLLPDGTGGVLISWGASNDPATATTFMLGQHFLASGEVAPGWPADGVTVCTELPQSQGPAAMAPDGAGGFYVVWDDWRTDPGYNDANIYAQHVSAAGSIPAGWPADGLPLVVLGDTQWDSKACADGQGGLYATWEDYRDLEERAYLIRVGPDGQRLSGWPESGLVFTTQPGYQLDMSLVPDGLGGVYVAWSNYAGEYKVFVQHLTGAGTPAAGWATRGLPLAGTPSEQQAPVILEDGAGGAIIAWDDGRDYPVSGVDIYAQRVVSDGPVPVAIALVSTEATPTEVRLRWFAGGSAGVVACLYRREERTEWRRLATVSADGTGHLEFVDRDVIAGTRYAYRLGVASGSGESFTAETWVTVPVALGLALEGLRPNPAISELFASFTLPTASPASLELLDVSGRRMLIQEVGSLGPGRHLVRLDARGQIPAGLYWLRLKQRDERRLARAAVVR